MSVMAETSQPAMGPYVASDASKARTAFFRESLLIKVPAALVGPGGGDGGAGGGDGGAGGGDGEGQCVISQCLNLYSAALNFLSAFLNLASHFVHFLLPAASTLVARRSEMRSMNMSFIVSALCVPARRQADGA